MTGTNYLLFVSVLLPLLASPLTYLLGRHSWKRGAVLCHVSCLIPFLIILYQAPTIMAGKQLYEAYSWIPAFGLNLNFMLDNLSYPFALLISLMGFLASVYSHRYMEHESRLEIYYPLLQIFQTGMMGVVLSWNLFMLYIFWEVMLIPSYFLIAYWGTGNPRLIGFKYFIFTHAGALCMLLGIAWLNSIFGSMDMSSLLENVSRAYEIHRASLLGIAVLVFIGAAVKMAVFPFHTWLPDAHAEAPTPISVLLSGVMIKTGVYAFARLLLGLMPSAVFEMSAWLMPLAVVTMLWGGIMALVQNDVKRLLAYSSVSQMGYILFGLSSLAPVGISGGLFHVLNHGFAKGLLFMGAGALIHEVKERDVSKLGGLASKMPVTAIVMLVAGLSIAGTPPLGGFASEWMIFSGTFMSGTTLLTSIAIVATAITAAYYLRMVRAIFFLEPKHEGVKEAPVSMVFPMNILLLLVIVLGFVNAPILSIIGRAVSAWIGM
ncbi:MAG: NADH-quinone oxidoreductase subunit L [Nitrososphaerota archaeon]